MAVSTEQLTPTGDHLSQIGALIRDARKHRGLTQVQLAERLGTSQSAVHRMEQGQQNVSIDMLQRVGHALQDDIVSIGRPGPTHLRVHGGVKLSGSIAVKSSKNAGVALLCAALLNKGRTTLRGVARILEIHRILDVLGSIGVEYAWVNENDLVLDVPNDLDLEAMDGETARRTRSIIMMLGPLLHRYDEFALPYAGGCDLGTRTVEPHMVALRPFGLQVTATTGNYHATVDRTVAPQRPIVLTERGDTVTENALMAAARVDGVTTIRNASPNYMVQDLCFFLELLGVRIEGIGTTTLVVHGVPDISVDVEYAPSEDPVEAMSLLTAAIITHSELTGDARADRVPRDRAGHPRGDGLRYDLSPEYPAANGRTRLVDITVHPSELKAPIDKIHPMPFPGLNIDNLPFFAVIAASAEGSTTVHDWVYDNRAIYLTELNRLGARVKLLDPHRVLVEGPTRWSGAEVLCPPALRPAVVVLLAMLAAKGTSVLRNVDIIARGYEQLAERLTPLGAQIETFRD